MITITKTLHDNRNAFQVELQNQLLDEIFNMLKLGCCLNAGKCLNSLN